MIKSMFNLIMANKREDQKMNDYIKEIRFNTKSAENFFAEKMAFTLGPVELKAMLEKQKAKPNGVEIKVIDVRHKEDFDEAHIPEAISIPKSELEKEIGMLSKNDLHIIYCYSQQCHLAAGAALFLAKNDYPVMELEGGFSIWKEYGMETT